MNPYLVGKRSALKKLGMKLTFDSPEAAQKHHKQRGQVGKALGTAGSVIGGTVGGTAGSAAGPVGTVGGSLAGASIGEKALQAPATTMYDAGHDVQQRTKDTYNSSLARMNNAAGIPTEGSSLKETIRSKTGELSKTAVDPYVLTALGLGSMLGTGPAIAGSDDAYIYDDTSNKSSPLITDLIAGTAGVPAALGGGYASGSLAKRLGAGPRVRTLSMLGGAPLSGYLAGRGIGEISKIITDD